MYGIEQRSSELEKKRRRRKKVAAPLERSFNTVGIIIQQSMLFRLKRGRRGRGRRRERTTQPGCRERRRGRWRRARRRSARERGTRREGREGKRRGERGAGEGRQRRSRRDIVVRVMNHGRRHVPTEYVLHPGRMIGCMYTSGAKKGGEREREMYGEETKAT